jgi:hypothetical protein
MCIPSICMQMRFFRVWYNCIFPWWSRELLAIVKSLMWFVSFENLPNPGHAWITRIDVLPASTSTCRGCWAWFDALQFYESDPNSQYVMGTLSKKQTDSIESSFPRSGTSSKLICELVDSFQLESHCRVYFAETTDIARHSEMNSPHSHRIMIQSLPCLSRSRCSEAFSSHSKMRFSSLLAGKTGKYADWNDVHGRDFAEEIVSRLPLTWSNVPSSQPHWSKGMILIPSHCDRSDKSLDGGFHDEQRNREIMPEREKPWRNQYKVNWHCL